MLDALGIRRRAAGMDLLEILAGWAADADASGEAPRASLGQTAAAFKYLAEALDAAGEEEAAALRVRLSTMRWLFVPDHPRPSHVRTPARSQHVRASKPWCQGRWSHSRTASLMIIATWWIHGTGQSLERCKT
jgi:hypothetical protein